MTVPILNLGARWGWVVNATPRPLYPRRRDPVPIVQEAVKPKACVKFCVGDFQGKFSGNF
jgi:hypothetical protein